MAIKDRIKEARLKKGYTQEQLAQIIGIAKSTLAGYELGSREPSLVMIIKIMKATDVDANYLWQDEMEFSTKISYAEQELIKKYRDLDDHGKEMVDFTLLKEWERSTNNKDKIVSIAPHLTECAASERTDIDVTTEQIENDNEVMENPNEWK